MNAREKTVRLVLDRALKSLDMTDAGTCGVDDEHKQAMKLYLDTWVSPLIRQSIEVLEGNRPARSIEFWIR